MGSYAKDITLAASTASAAVLLCTAPVIGFAPDAGDQKDDQPHSLTADSGNNHLKGLTKEEILDMEIQRITELKKEMNRSQPRRGNQQSQGLRGGPVPGDDCSDPIVLNFETEGEASVFTWTGDTSTATDNLNEECPFSNTGAPELVYLWTADADGLMTINLCAGPTEYDTKLYVYENLCDANLIGCNDDACVSAPPASQSFVSRLDNLPVEEGNQYYIVVDGWSGTNSGFFEAEMSFAPAPDGPINDTCAEAYDIFDAGGVDPNTFPVTITGNTTQGTHVYDETCEIASTAGAPDLVYSYTPDVPVGETTFISVDLCAGATTYDSKIYMYENACPGTVVGCSDDACTSAAGQPFVSRLTNVEVEGGNTYFIVVDGWSPTSAGEFVMTIDETPPPPPAPDCQRATGGQAAVLANAADDDVSSVISLSDSELGFLQIARLNAAQGVQINSLRWWGTEVEWTQFGGFGAVVPCFDESRTFNITFYNDLFGAPGSVQCEYLDVSVTAEPTSIFPLELGGLPQVELIQYDFELPGGGCATPGGWVSIDGNTPHPGAETACAWLWASGGTDPGNVASLSLATASNVLTESDVNRSLCAIGFQLNPGAFTGACCSTEFGPVFGEDCLIADGGTCASFANNEFFPFLECEDIECFVPQGACCTGDTGDEASEYLCLGIMSAPDCADAGDLFDPSVATIWLGDESCFSCPIPPPAGDDCADPIVVESGDSILATNAGATSGPGEVGASCVFGGAPNIHSIWFAFTAPSEGTAIFDTCGSPLDTVMAVLDACPDDDGVEIACNDDFCGLQSQISLDLLEGETVLVRVAGWNNAQGPFIFNVEFLTTGACCLGDGTCVDNDPDACALLGGTFKGGLTCDVAGCNDRCELAEQVTGDLEAGVSITAINANATEDGFDATSPCAFSAAGGVRGVWYEFTAPCDGLVDIIHTATLPGFSTDTEMLLFDITDGCPDPGDTTNLVGCGGDENCDGGGTFSACITNAPVEAGRTYALRVAGWGSGTVGAEIDITVHDCTGGPPACPGDANGDGVVNVDDLIMVISNWGTTGPDGDVTDDGIVNVDDLIEVISNWGNTCP